MKQKAIEYENDLTRHFILFSKGHYQRTDDILEDIRTLLSNRSWTDKKAYTDEAIFTFVSECFVDSCTKNNIKELLKCFYRKPWFLGEGQATLGEMVSHMIGMMACIQVYDDIDGKMVELVKLGEPDPRYLPTLKKGEKSKVEALGGKG